ncbi:ATP synthase F1 subunit epsilon [Acetobacter fabarum]|jgi:F-type H+-transporting ATPase subunit epsilon|uniref:ATP synthase epsilon chain n=1 Tax=Acetobacter fabarum TaxID=483199 RepID=A0A269XVR8_9PROT|nr:MULTISPECIES: ATP synthase F1 subunit epsilon [Acetobacter]MDN6713527.1 ATP synthase F1 subunit epsilon [Acetobacter sp.]MCH4025532.1 ATP synthase F1 subunit epsilon [Acetobacter fabarum]MCH4086608.1 ATP synthase F1 subunit epsilon [Acetobacter fabarum]MCH4128121.1 ATP synthase F1 subunit epsilon [Acetobacter fabarum]MCH4138482.1 ATP synthase F1 subunit epsilon [Acetobacter fabarum]
MPIQIEIISPEKVLVSREVDMAVLPGMEGDIAAMPEHSPMMLLLRGGVVALYEGDKVTDRYFVGGGFADITPARCTVLADKAVPVSDISIDMATAQLEALSEAWDKADKTDTSRLVVLQDQIQAVRAEIEAGSAS